jgi:hypothetical protein
MARAISVAAKEAGRRLGRYHIERLERVLGYRFGQMPSPFRPLIRQGTSVLGRRMSLYRGPRTLAIASANFSANARSLCAWSLFFVAPGAINPPRNGRWKHAPRMISAQKSMSASSFTLPNRCSALKYVPRCSWDVCGPLPTFEAPPGNSSAAPDLRTGSPSAEQSADRTARKPARRISGSLQLFLRPRGRQGRLTPRKIGEGPPGRRKGGDPLDHENGYKCCLRRIAPSLAFCNDRLKSS